MKKLNMVVFAFALNQSMAYAQVSQERRNFSDSSTARLNQITTNTVDPGSNFVSAKQNAMYFNDESTFQWVSCPSGYQNRSVLPIFINIEAQYGHRAMTGLLVKRRLNSPWVNSGFVRDAGIAAIMIPPGAIYCPITNHHWGLWWISVATPGQGDLAHPVRVYDVQTVRERLSITVGDRCYNITEMHINYRMDGTTFNTYWGVDYMSGTASYEVDVNDARISRRPNGCIPDAGPPNTDN